MLRRLHDPADAPIHAPSPWTEPSRTPGMRWRFVEDFVVVALLAALAIAAWTAVPR